MISVREAKEEKVRRVLQRDLTTYKKRMFRSYQHAPHLEILDRALEQVSLFVESGGQEGIGRLIVEMPPRHGKTLTVSRLYPTWHLGRNPDHRVMLVSYGHTLANKNSRAARNLIRSNNYVTLFPNVKLADDSAAADAWDIKDYAGGCDALGITGAATGKGAHLLIIDDPVKNRQEAESKVYRERVWDAYTNDLYTRLEPGGAIIIMMTRWHKDDLVGKVLADVENEIVEYETDDWERISLPAIAEEDDTLLRAPGEALWAWRYPIEVLNKIAKAVGRYAWAALYQQRPKPREGGIFKWDDIDGHRVTALPELMRVGVAVDPSGSSGGDEVGIVAAGIARDGHAYILEDASLQASPNQWANTCSMVYNKYMADFLVAEKNFGGEMVELTVKTVDKDINYKAVTASRGKEIRAEPISAKYEQGLVHHVGDPKQFAQMEDEMTTWKPGGDSPNRMDALVFVLTELMLNQGEASWSDYPDELQFTR